MAIMSEESMKKIVLKMAESSRFEWEFYLDSLIHLQGNEISLSQLTDYTSSMAIHFAEMSEYLGKRGGYGTGDSGHNNAMGSVNKTKKAVRKALDYIIP